MLVTRRGPVETTFMVAALIAGRNCYRRSQRDPSLRGDNLAAGTISAHAESQRIASTAGQVAGDRAVLENEPGFALDRDTLTEHGFNLIFCPNDLLDARPVSSFGIPLVGERPDRGDLLRCDG